MAQSRPAPRRGTGPAGRPNRRRLPVPWPILLLLLAAMAAAGYSAFAPSAHAVVHPHPRADVGPERIQPPERYASDPRIAQIYEEVSRIPRVIDGIYCYCHCSRHSQHYSLLSCFEDDHGANCDVCLNQAHLAYLLTRQGRSLDEIRLAMDQQYGPRR
jgi:hypothetical protein